VTSNEAEERHSEEAATVESEETRTSNETANTRLCRFIEEAAGVTPRAGRHRHN
jgi:hypothetical protein